MGRRNKNQAKRRTATKKERSKPKSKPAATVQTSLGAIRPSELVKSVKTSVYGIRQYIKILFNVVSFSGPGSRYAEINSAFDCTLNELHNLESVLLNAEHRGQLK